MSLVERHLPSGEIVGAQHSDYGSKPRVSIGRNLIVVVRSNPRNYTRESASGNPYWRDLFLEARAGAGKAGARGKSFKPGSRHPYSTLAPEAFTTLPHFTTSSWMKEPNSCGVQAVASAPCCKSFSFMSAWRSALFTSALMREITSFGAPLGSMMPNHAVSS